MQDIEQIKTAQSAYNYCALPLAAYACRPDRTRGRLHEEPESAIRTCFQRDRDRIIHCAAFRRLRHKTQVFVYHEGDHYRTRLTHTLEVAQIARTMARALKINEDLAEAVALAHDLGHPPFAHVGEDELKECMADVGGFDHNDQSLRVLVTLEHKYPRWEGLNLSWETLEGVVKHNGPVREDEITETVAYLQTLDDFRLGEHASLESQVAGLADDVAYNNHDVEDGLSAGLFSLSDIEDVDLLAEAKRYYKKEYTGISGDLLRSGIVRRVIGAMVTDILEETERRLAETGATSPDDIREAGRTLVAFSENMHDKVEEMREFLWERMYRHEHVEQMRDKVIRVIRTLYRSFMADPAKMPEEWQDKVPDDPADKKGRARVVADYIAGMTDRYAFRAYEHLTGERLDV